MEAIKEQDADPVHALREPFESWYRSTVFEDAHRIGTDVLERAVDIHLSRLYRELELHRRLDTPRSARQLADELSFDDSAWIAVEAMLLRLAHRHDFVQAARQDDAWHFRSTAEPPPENSAALDELETQMQALGNDYVAPMEFLKFGAAHFVHALRDDTRFMDRVLTGQEGEHAETWHRATNTDPLQDVHGILGAKAVELLFEGGTILEVGGGTGNGIRNNLDMLRSADRLGEVDKYVFTDVSMPFIVGTRQTLKDRYPDTSCEWRLLNINKDFQAQRIEPASADLIYGVNAAHIAQHTVDFIKACRKVLRPGGLMVFSERIRRSDHDMAPREIVLNLSNYHRTAAIRHPEYRPAHAYLARDHWLRACELAGCSAFDVWPADATNQHYFPDQYAAVVVARA